jgi:hypothetical protein
VVALTNFDADYAILADIPRFWEAIPGSGLTAVIFGADQAKFGAPGTTLQGKRVCVSGLMRQYRAKREIILNDPRQLVQ